MQNKFLPFIFSFVLVIVVACNRKVNSENKTSAAALIGTWELREDQSGMIPTRQHPEGNGDRYRFTATTYERYQNGALEKSGVYRVELDSTVQKEVGLQLPPGEFTHRIVFEDDPSAPKTFFQLNGDKLVLLSGYFPTDGGSRYTYQRITGNE
ncbi:MAG TPA: hypothetical protein VGN63_02840 [Flavisolibacter sp.]|jgi:hypothetical protein|nr:hypothetical protein [Flavisolibacter sp.]